MKREKIYTRGSAELTTLAANDRIFVDDVSGDARNPASYITEDNLATQIAAGIPAPVITPPSVAVIVEASWGATKDIVPTTNKRIHTVSNVTADCTVTFTPDEETYVTSSGDELHCIVKNSSGTSKSVEFGSGFEMGSGTPVVTLATGYILSISFIRRTNNDSMVLSNISIMDATLLNL